MMRERRLSAFLALTISLLLLPAATLPGCRHQPAPPAETAAEEQVRQVKAAGAHAPAFYSAMPDDALLGQHEEKGLELGLKMDAATYTSGAPIAFHILIRDRAATEPIAAGLCSGLSLQWQKLDDNTADSVNIDNRHCFDTIPSPDERALTRGAVKTVDITQHEASNASFAPGTYLISLQWQPYAAGRGTIMGRQPYATLRSNVILFTVTP